MTPRMPRDAQACLEFGEHVARTATALADEVKAAGVDDAYFRGIATRARARNRELVAIYERVHRECERQRRRAVLNEPVLLLGCSVLLWGGAIGALAVDDWRLGVTGLVLTVVLAVGTAIEVRWPGYRVIPLGLAGLAGGGLAMLWPGWPGIVAGVSGWVVGLLAIAVASVTWGWRR